MSALYNKWKKGFIDILHKRSDIWKKEEVFYDSAAEIDDILEAVVE